MNNHAKTKRALRWHKSARVSCYEADMGQGRLATICPQDWRAKRKWVLRMTGPDACGGFFEAKFHSVSDAKSVADMMCDVGGVYKI